VSTNPGRGIGNLLTNKVLVASFGFDERFALRAISDHRPRKIIAVALDTGPSARNRVEKAFHQLQLFALSLGADAELLEIRYSGEPVSRLSWIIRKRLRSLIEGYSGVVVLLSGGPRILVVALLLASMALRGGTGGEVLVRIDGEGFDALVEEPVDALIPAQLGDDKVSQLLELLVEYTEKGQSLGPSEAARILGIPRSTAHRWLRRLVEEGLADYNPDTGLYRATPRAYVSAAGHTRR